MDAIIERCCGIDVHKQSLTACLLAGSLEGKPEATIKTFSTMTNDLLQLKDWLEKEVKGDETVILRKAGR